MKRSKKILFSLGAVLPVAGGLLLTSCSQVVPKTAYGFAADADFRRAAFGNIGTINQVKNVVENSLQLPAMAPTVTVAAEAEAKTEAEAGADSTDMSSAEKTGTMDGAGTQTTQASGSSTGSSSTSSTTTTSTTAASAETSATTMATVSTPEAAMPTAMMSMASGAWKHFEAIVNGKSGKEKNTAQSGLVKFYNDFKTKFDEVLKFAGNKNLTDGSASLEDLRTSRNDLVTKGQALFTVYNEFGKALGESTTFDTTKSFEELAQANQGLNTFYKLMSVDVYNFAKPVAGNSYNDLARFFEALNGFLGTQFANNATTSNVFQLFGNITALLISRQLRIIDGAINSVLLTTPENNKDGIETQLLANVNKNSTIKQRYDETVKALSDVKAQTDQWANNPIVMKVDNQQSKLEMAAAKANEESKAILTRLVNALYGNASNMPGFAVKGLFGSVRDLGAQLDSVKSLVSDNYTKLSDFISFYKMTNATWREGVGIFVNSLALNALTTDAIDKLAAAETSTDDALFMEVKDELKKLVAATSSLPKNGAGQDKKSAFYLNQMVRSITSDNQARLASIGEGINEFSFYVNTAL